MMAGNSRTLATGKHDMDHNVASSMPPPELPPLKKPSSADAFGIMNLVFGIGGPLAMVA